MTSGFPLECFVVGTERGEVDEAVEEVVGPGGDGIAVHGWEKLEWANHISNGQNFESIEEIVHRGLEGQPTIASDPVQHFYKSKTPNRTVYP